MEKPDELRELFRILIVLSKHIGVKTPGMENGESRHIHG